jgi:hypothetical protein
MSSKLGKVLKSVITIVFPHQNIHKYIWTSPNGKIHSQIEHILKGYPSFREADCDTDHYLVVTKVTDRLYVSKQHRTLTIRGLITRS